MQEGGSNLGGNQAEPSNTGVPESPAPVRILGQELTGITDEAPSTASVPTPPSNIIYPSSTPEQPIPPEPQPTVAPVDATPPQDLPPIPTSQPEPTPVDLGSVPATPTPPVAPEAPQPIPPAPQQVATPPSVPPTLNPNFQDPFSNPVNPNYAEEFKQSVDATIDPTNTDNKGDIILHKDKKSKKGLIIGIISVLIIIAVGAIAAALILTRNNTTNLATTKAPTSIAPTQDAKELFYSYANEIIYGNESNEPLQGNPDNINFTYAQKIYNGADSDQKYLEQIQRQYNDFYSNLSFDVIDSDNQSLYQYTTDYKQLLEFLVNYASDENFNHAYFVDLYLENGVDGATEIYNDYLSDIPDGNTYTDEFVNLKNQEFSDTMAYMDYLNNSGCIIDSAIDQECFAIAIDTDLDFNNLDIAVFNDTKNVHSLLNAYYDFIGEKCWPIQEVLQ